MGKILSSEEVDEAEDLGGIINAIREDISCLKVCSVFCSAWYIETRYAALVMPALLNIWIALNRKTLGFRRCVLIL